MKRLFATMMAMSLLVSGSALPVAAASGNTLKNVTMPIYEYTNITTTSLNISSSGVATATARLAGYRNLTTKIVIFMYLEKKVDGKWKLIKNWSTSDSTYSLTLEEKASVESGYTYRVRTSYYAYSGNDREYIEEYSREVRY